SGGSTITMQTARLLEPRPRTIGSKLIEMVRAIQIERRLSKTEILELYLTLAPYGGNLEGVRAASLGWFGHEPSRLTDDEIALLVAIPQSPERRRPDRYPDVAAKSRADIGARLAVAGAWSVGRAAELAEAPLPHRHAFPARAWHASASARWGVLGDVQSTLDAALQSDLEALLAAKAKTFGPEVQLAGLVVDIETRAVRASIGSASREVPGGWLDLTKRVRSPGSTLKPFIYAMAFDDGLADPQTRIEDLPKRFAAYQPENFDRGFNGQVTVSEALQHSLNVPAVIALDRVGPDRFAAQLAGAGAPPHITGVEGRAGLALALGGAGLTAEDLAVLYAALGDNGLAKPLVWRAGQEETSIAAPGRRFIRAASSRQILDILRNAPAPAGHVPATLIKGAPQIAFKTGTSYGFRDAWAAGVSGRFAIVIWVGRADGAPRPGHVGRSDALPILFEVADRAAARLGDDTTNAVQLTDGRKRPASPTLANFSAAAAPEILFPPSGAELWGGGVDGEPPRAFVLSGRGTGPLRWFIDGKPCPLDDAGLPIWAPPEPGFYLVSAVDETGRESRVRVRVIA
ncbi:MAG: penicillin-binding protein 1C, partial [Pseudomonadota bacterium]